MSFQISGLPAAQFQHLFSQSDEELLAAGSQRMIVDEYPGTPCRISLRDVKVGESVLLINYQHQPTASPYQSSHAIYIHEDAVETALQPNAIPEQLRIRLLSVRAFDNNDMIIDAEVTEGDELAEVIERLFKNPTAQYLHVHNAKRGCYAALVKRHKDDAGQFIRNQ